MGRILGEGVGVDLSQGLASPPPPAKPDGASPSRSPCSLENLQGLAFQPPPAKPKRASGLAGASAGRGGIGGATAPDGPPQMIVASPSRSPGSLERYRRQLSLEGFGPEGQERLKNSTALVAGVGGLGGTVALYLAAAGIGRLSLIHQGVLDLPDLNRQILMSPERIGESRVRCAEERLREFNPEVGIVILDGRVCEENVVDLVGRADIVVSCRYNFEEREILNRACVALRKPMVEAAMNGLEAYLTLIIPGDTPCLRCLYPEFPDWDPMGFPVLGAVSGTLGCLAAVEAIKVLTGIGAPLLGRLLYFDLSDMTFRKFKVTRRRECSVCGGRSEGDDLREMVGGRNGNHGR